MSNLAAENENENEDTESGGETTFNLSTAHGYLQA